MDTSNDNSKGIKKKIEKLQDIANRTAQVVIDHPGFMWTNGGFEVLHADWPAYPIGHGLVATLAPFSEFPDLTSFFPIDRIDLCTLFVADKIPIDDKFHKRHYHIALWDEDIQLCLLNHFISGARINEDYRSIEYSSEGIQLSSLGLHAATFHEFTIDLNLELFICVKDLIYAQKYDMAIREASILIETRLRKISGCSANEYGQKLINICFEGKRSILPLTITNTQRIQIHSTFRRFFKFVRNEYAHNFHSLDLVTTIRLLQRASTLLNLLSQLETRR